MIKRLSSTLENDSRESKTKAFTLVELLVVLAILALLAAMLFSALARARSNAWCARCQSNLRQVGIGLALYKDDFYAFPKTRGNWGGAITYRQWQPLLEPYVQSHTATRSQRSVLACPSTEGTRYRLGSGFVQVPHSYGYNHDGYVVGYRPEKFRGLGGSSLVDPTRESEVVAPSSMIAVGDGTMNGPTNAVAATDLGLSRAATPLWSGDFSHWIDRAQRRHHGRVNIAFCDGHVAKFTLKALFIDDDDEALRRWNKDNEPHRSD